MLDGVWSTILKATGAIIVAVISEYLRRVLFSRNQRVCVQIDSPEYGQVVPAVFPVSGKVLGFSRKKIQSKKLRIAVDIKTNDWYPQGIAEVADDGCWKLEKAHFGGRGAPHHIRATILDSSEECLSAETVVTSF